MITLQVDERSVAFRQDGAPAGAALPLGPALLVERWLRHDPPTAAELEAAIEAVEDLVMPLHRQLAHQGSLRVTGAAAAQVAQLAGPTPTLADVEDLFNRAAAVAEGRPGSSDPALARPQAMAVVLLLREVMHHLAFERLAVAPP